MFGNLGAGDSKEENSVLKQLLMAKVVTWL